MLLRCPSSSRGLGQAFNCVAVSGFNLSTPKDHPRALSRGHLQQAARPPARLKAVKPQAAHQSGGRQNAAAHDAIITLQSEQPRSCLPGSARRGGEDWRRPREPRPRRGRRSPLTPPSRQPSVPAGRAGPGAGEARHGPARPLPPRRPPWLGRPSGRGSTAPPPGPGPGPGPGPPGMRRRSPSQGPAPARARAPTPTPAPASAPAQAAGWWRPAR